MPKLKCPEGRRTYLDDQMIEYLASYMPQAQTLNQLARLSGIPQSSLNDWIFRGKADREKDKQSIYAQLSLRYETEKGKKIKKYLEKMEKLESFQSIQWLLENCYPDEFGINARMVEDILKKIEELQKKILGKESVNGEELDPVGD